jgi:hypothetical protein
VVLVLVLVLAVLEVSVETLGVLHLHRTRRVVIEE